MSKIVAIFNSSDRGSTGKIANGLFSYFESRDCKALFFYGRGEKTKGNKIRMHNRIGFLKNVFLSRVTGLEGYFSISKTKKMIKRMLRENVSLVYAVNLHGFYLNHRLFFNFLRKNKIPLVYILADEYPYLGKCAYHTSCEKYKKICNNCPQKNKYPISYFFDFSKKIQADKRKYYDGNNIAFIGPKIICNDAKESTLLRDKYLVEQDEAINTSFYTPRKCDEIIRKYNIDVNKKIVVCVSPSALRRKRVDLFIKLAALFEDNNDYHFVLAGYTEKQKIEKENLTIIGFVDNQDELAQLYSIGDIFVFPSELDSMPNSCLEAMSSGTPILCFDISGMSYLGYEPVVKLIKPFDLDSMKTYLLNIGKKKQALIDECRNYALLRYSSDNYNKRLEAIGDSLLNGK